MFSNDAFRTNGIFCFIQACCAGLLQLGPRYLGTAVKFYTPGRDLAEEEGEENLEYHGGFNELTGLFKEKKDFGWVRDKLVAAGVEGI